MSTTPTSAERADEAIRDLDLKAISAIRNATEWIIAAYSNGVNFRHTEGVERVEDIVRKAVSAVRRAERESWQQREQQLCDTLRKCVDILLRHYSEESWLIVEARAALASQPAPTPTPQQDAELVAALEAANNFIKYCRRIECHEAYCATGYSPSNPCDCAFSKLLTDYLDACAALAGAQGEEQQRPRDFVAETFDNEERTTDL